MERDGAGGNCALGVVSGFSGVAYEGEGAKVRGGGGVDTVKSVSEAEYRGAAATESAVEIASRPGLALPAFEWS